jgi:hypothetical protein
VKQLPRDYHAAEGALLPGDVMPPTPVETVPGGELALGIGGVLLPVPMPLRLPMLLPLPMELPVLLSVPGGMPTIPPPI